MDHAYVVVDGSNIATEGRSVPSLGQLDQAVRQFQAEFPGSEMIVVVDATFGHRIDPSEREAFDEAVAHAELVSPPAGAVGRGDAFLLRVAERVGGQVLSNDSFQEFHAEHPWLFDEGRLIGGKPVPGAGWIFTPRSPVRGARSRASMAAGSRAARAEKADKAAKSDRAVKADKADKAAKSDKAVKAAKSDKAVKAAKSDKAAKSEKAAKSDKAAKSADKSARTGKAAKSDEGAITGAVAGPKRAKAATVSAAGTTGTVGAAGETAGAGAPVPVGGDSERPAARSRRRRGRRASGPDVRAAIDAATTEAIEPPEPNAGTGAGTRSRRRADPPPAVNDPLTFLTFVTEHPVGSTLEGTVSSFVSHGAMVDVGGMLCYVPLAGLGSPPPRGAREVIERGQHREFVLVALDPPRRGAELALPEVAAGSQSP